MPSLSLTIYWLKLQWKLSAEETDESHEIEWAVKCTMKGVAKPVCLRGMYMTSVA